MAFLLINDHIDSGCGGAAGQKRKRPSENRPVEVAAEVVADEGKLVKEQAGVREEQRVREAEARWAREEEARRVRERREEARLPDGAPCQFYVIGAVDGMVDAVVPSSADGEEWTLEEVAIEVQSPRKPRPSPFARHIPSHHARAPCPPPTL